MINTIDAILSAYRKGYINNTHNPRLTGVSSTIKRVSARSPRRGAVTVGKTIVYEESLSSLLFALTSACDAFLLPSWRRLLGKAPPTSSLPETLCK